MKKLFIGIDFSKEKFDVSFFERGYEQLMHHHVFLNNATGFKSLISWLQTQTAIPTSEWLFCGENTGLYSLCLSSFLVRQGLFMWLENPLQIKKTTGIKRLKNDKVDSREIALYCFRFEDKARLYKISGKSITALRLLFTYRERLIRCKNTLQMAAKENRKILDDNTTSRMIYDDTMQLVSGIDEKLRTVEKEMEQIIAKETELKENYKVVRSVKGIGIVNAIAIMITTDNFTKFASARQFACYCGVVPFDQTSGSSLHKGKHVSRIANIKLKTYLTQAARSAVMFDDELKIYYERKKKEGKKDQVIINNVRNKLLQRIFAVIRKKTMFERVYENHLKVSA